MFSRLFSKKLTSAQLSCLKSLARVAIKGQENLSNLAQIYSCELVEFNGTVFVLKQGKGPLVADIHEDGFWGSICIQTSRNDYNFSDLVVSKGRLDVLIFDSNAAELSFDPVSCSFLEFRSSSYAPSAFGNEEIDGITVEILKDVKHATRLESYYTKRLELASRA